jgi:hypothetical protein
MALTIRRGGLVHPIQRLESRRIRNKLRNHHFQVANQVEVVLLFDQLHKKLQLVIHFVVGTRLHLGNLDLGMVGNLHQLVVIQQLLVQLFAFTKASKLNIYIQAHLLTRELNHAASKVHNLDRASHIKHLHFSPIPQDGCL